MRKDQIARFSEFLIRNSHIKQYFSNFNKSAIAQSGSWSHSTPSYDIKVRHNSVPKWCRT